MDVDQPVEQPEPDEDEEDLTTKLVSRVEMVAPPRFTMQSVPIKYKCVWSLHSSSPRLGADHGSFVRCDDSFKAATTMEVLTTNALDEDRYVYKNKNRGAHLTVYMVDSTDVSRPLLLYPTST